jgi:two-component system NtrC family sensor kinase
MTAPIRRRFRLGLQAKVLIAVMGFLILLPIVTLWIVNQRMQQQMDDEALWTLGTTQAVFLNSLDLRSQNFSARYRGIVDEARFQVTAEVTNSKTIEGLLGKVLDESAADAEVILFCSASGELVAGQHRASSVDKEKFAHAAMAITRGALEGTPATGSVALDGRAYSVISVPVMGSNGPLVGALTVGIRLGEATLKELKGTRTEILLVAQNQVIVSTVPNSDLSENLLSDLIPNGVAPARSLRGQNAQHTMVSGEHFLARAGAIDAAGSRPSGVSYVILSSYEHGVRALEETRRTLVGLSLAGVLVSSLTVSWLVRRVTRPLRELRDSAEAVGQGDFSRRLTQYSNDECGELAETFNRMTGNLQSSRTELEKAVDTLKNTQAQLIQSEKLSAVGQFVAGVAHELNNPLTAVIGFSDLLAQTSTDQKIRPHLDIIAKSAHRCHKIVENLLGFARQHPPERKLIAIKDSMVDVLEIMNYDLRTSNVKVVRDFQEDLPAIMADAHQLQQVFINILSNARQAIQSFRSDGEITVRLRTSGPMIRIEFQDNGPGIRPEHLSRIFDPFFTTKPVGKGTGLGMSLSYGIIHEHGGQISVRSELGAGAHFVIELPVAVDGNALRNGTSHPFLRASLAPAAAGRCVLVVDDEEWILKLTAALLRQQEYEVETFLEGDGALERLGQRKFDVVVCDWKMPGLSGIQLYERLCATDAVSASRTIFMTGDVISDTFQEFLRRNSKMCLTKPFAIDDFRSAVANMAAAANA